MVQSFASITCDVKFDIISITNMTIRGYEYQIYQLIVHISNKNISRLTYSCALGFFVKLEHIGIHLSIEVGQPNFDGSSLKHI